MSLSDLVRQGRGLYWLLDFFSKGPWAVSAIDVRENHKPGQFPDHGLDREELIHALLRMQAQGWLRFQCGDDYPLLDSEELSAALSHDAKFEYFNAGLTEIGGVQWESLVHPDWSLYLHHSSQCADDEGEDPTADWAEEYQFVEGTRREWLLRYIGNLRLHHLTNSFGRAEPCSIEVETLEPYKPFHWKTLPEGYRITFRWKPRDESPFSPQEIEELRIRAMGDSSRYRRCWCRK